MTHRLAVAILCLAALFAGRSAPPALAHGPILKGTQITHSTYMAATTGSCECDDKWFTVGLRPGTIKVTAQLQRCGDRATSVCSIEVYLIRRNTGLKSVKSACFSSQARCNRAAVMSYKIQQRGPYYLLVRGSGTYTIFYSLRIQGAIYDLHCNKYC